MVHSCITKELHLALANFPMDTTEMNYQEEICAHCYHEHKFLSEWKQYVLTNL